MQASLATTERRVTAAAAKALVGRTVRRVRYMSAREADESCWEHRPLVLEFDDGTTLYTTCDEEGNDAGVLFVEQGERELCLGRLPADEETAR